MKKTSKSGEILILVLQIIGATFAIPILVLCTIRGAIEYGAAGVLTGLAFSVSMLVLSVLSAVFHGRKLAGKKGNGFRIMDYCTLFFMSAGVYTPIALIALMKIEPAVAWTLFGAVWLMSIWGILLNLKDSKRFLNLSMACYLGLSWCVILCLPRLVTLLPPIGTILMFVGAACYTAGGMVFGFERGLKHPHAWFHLLMSTGSISYAFMILLCVL